jgi:hypothetical protein
MVHGRRWEFCGFRLVLLLEVLLCWTAASLLPPEIAPKATAVGENVSEISPVVHVFDNVITESLRERLVDACRKLHKSSVSDDDLYFEFPLESAQGTEEAHEFSFIETVLSDIIHEMIRLNRTRLGEDSSRPAYYVEYWTRHVWTHIVPHADMDEGYYWRQFNSMGEDEQQQSPIQMRYPEFGHVLYLQVGSEVSGPTTVFTNASSGGDILRNYPTVARDIDAKLVDENTLAATMPSSHGLIVVPAVPRRLLQFRGDLLHAVPRPADIWLTTSASQRNKALLQSRQHDPVSEFGRSVLLFNVYPAKDGKLTKHVKVRQRIETSTESTPTSLDQRPGCLCNNHTDWVPVSIDNTSLSSIDSDSATSKTTRTTVPPKVESVGVVWSVFQLLSSLFDFMFSSTSPANKLVPIEFPLLGDYNRRGGVHEQSIVLATSMMARDVLIREKFRPTFIPLWTRSKDPGASSNKSWFAWILSRSDEL